LPTSLGGVQVSIGGLPAPILYAQQDQINVQVPWEVPFELANATTQISVGSSTYSWTNTMALQAAAPAIFHADTSSQALAMNQDGTLNSASNPAAVGSTVALWGTGGGVTNPPGVTGGATPLDSLAPLALPVTVTVGSPPVQAKVTYSGVAPTLSNSVFQINFEVPAGVTVGPGVPLRISIGGVMSTDPPGINSPVGTTIAIQ